MEHSSAINNHTAERYLLGELTTVERDAYEEHFFSCPDCAEEIMSASDFIETAKQVVQKELRVESYGRVAQSFSWGRWLSWRSILQPIPAMACALLVTLSGVVGYQNVVTIPHLAQIGAPQLMNTFMLHSNTRSGTKNVSVLRGTSFALQFEMTSPKEGYKSYEASVLAKSNSKTVLSTIISAEGAEGSLALHIPAGTLQPGRYELLVQGVNGNRKGEPDRFPFELKLQD